MRSPVARTSTNVRRNQEIGWSDWLQVQNTIMLCKVYLGSLVITLSSFQVDCDFLFCEPVQYTLHAFPVMHFF